MSRSSRSNVYCHHRTNGPHDSCEDRQPACGSACRIGFFGCLDYPLRRCAQSLAGVDAGWGVFRSARARPIDLGVGCAGPNHTPRARRRHHAQRRSNRPLGTLQNRRSPVRAARRTSRSGSSRGPLRAAAPDLCRDGRRLGVVPRSPRRAGSSLRQCSGPLGRGRCRIVGVHSGRRVRASARASRAGRRSGQSPWDVRRRGRCRSSRYERRSRGGRPPWDERRACGRPRRWSCGAGNPAAGTVRDASR